MHEQKGDSRRRMCACADERMKKSDAIYVQEAVSCAPTTHTTHDIKKNNEQQQQHKKTTRQQQL